LTKKYNETKNCSPEKLGSVIRKADIIINEASNVKSRLINQCRFFFFFFFLEVFRKLRWQQESIQRCFMVIKADLCVANIPTAKYSQVGALASLLMLKFCESVLRNCINSCFRYS